MQVLLFLTALFAGFTGVFSGGRAVEPREVEQAFAAAAAVADVTPRAVRAEAEVVLEVPRSAPTAVREAALPVSAPVPGLAPVNERRLE